MRDTTTQANASSDMPGNSTSVDVTRQRAKVKVARATSTRTFEPTMPAKTPMNCTSESLPRPKVGDRKQ